MADGKLNFDTGIDISGFKAGIDGISSLASKGLSGLQSLGELGINALKQSATLTLDVMKDLGSKAVGFLGDSVQVGATFEQSMSQVQATMGITKDTIVDGVNQYELLSDTAKEMGATTQFSASQASDALNYLALAGYDAEKACNALPTVLNIAAAGGMELASASDMVTDAMSALGIEATSDNLTEFGDQLAKTAQKSNTSVSALGEAILTVGGTAKNLAGGTTELNTALGILADNGAKGSEGGTALRNIILALGTPTDKAKDQLEALGVEVYDAEGNMRPLNDVFCDLNKSMSNMTQEEKSNALSDIFNKVDLKSAGDLLANCGDRWDELNGYIEDSQGTCEDMAKTMNDNLNGDITSCQSALEGLQVALSESLNTDLRNIVQNATGYLGTLRSAFLDGGWESLGSSIADVLTKVVNDSKTMVSKYMTLGTRMITAIIEGISKNSDFITKSIGTLLTQALTSGGSIFGGTYALGLKLVSGIASSLAKNSSKLKGGISEMLNSVSNSIRSNVPLILEAGIEILKALLNGIVSNTALISVTIVELLEAFINLISSNASSFIDIGKSFLEQISLGFSEAGFGEIALELLQFILSGISNNVGTIIEIAMSLLEWLTNAIVDNLPMLLQSALEILLALATGIVNNLQTLFDCAMSLILMLAQFIVDNIPLLIDTAIEILLNLVYFIVDNLPLLITCAVQIIEKILSAISENTDKLVDCAIEILGVLAQFVIDNLDQLLDCVGELILKIVEFIGQCAGDLLEGALTIIYKLVEYLSDSKNLEKVGEFISSLWQRIKDFISGKNWGEIGVRIVEGILSGLLNFDMTGYLSQSGNDFADNWITGMRDILGIHSPSRLMADEVGVYLTPGIAVGMEDALPDTLNSINGTMNSMVSGIDVNGIYSQMQGLAMSQGSGSVPSYSGVMSQAYQSSQDTQQNSEGTQGTVVVENYLFKNSQKLNDLVIKAGITENARSGGTSI